MRYPTITVSDARELITGSHARIFHKTEAEEADAPDGTAELHRRMLLIVTVPPHDEARRRVFDLQLDASQLHPLRAECLGEAERYTGEVRAKVREALHATGTGLSGEMLLHGLGSLALSAFAPKYNILASSYNRRIGMRRLLQAERDLAVREYADVMAEMFSGEIDGRNPETGLIWHREEGVAYRAWQADARIAELLRRFRAGDTMNGASSAA